MMVPLAKIRVKVREVSFCWSLRFLQLLQVEIFVSDPAVGGTQAEAHVQVVYWEYSRS